mmetsp:Transcript_41447/g.81267  ORF Transcript_41447/g.81267 Transcript_41447/m.81267 type:complete len:111 (+) Transcript_41447:222-554(+)
MHVNLWNRSTVVFVSQRQNYDVLPITTVSHSDCNKPKLKKQIINLVNEECRCHYQGGHDSFSTGLQSCPMLSISTTTSSLCCRNTGGSRAKPTPSGVPVIMTVPGWSVVP